MKKFIGLFVLLMASFAIPAMAFSWGDVNPINWVRSALSSGGYTILAYILTGILGLAVFGTIAVTRIIATLKETGELMIHMSDALADRHITDKELKQLADDIRAVTSVWAKTPPAYVPDGPENTNAPA